MKFKLLHVRPHVWFFKQKETISKANSDDSSSEGSYVYKRSTSLKLVKSDPAIGPAKRDNQPVHASKPSSNLALQLPNLGKNVRVCTVVDAGCTCRATVSSEQKQKKGMAMPRRSAQGDSGSRHDVCRPRWVQVFESRDNVGSMQDVCRPRRGQLNQKQAIVSSASPAPAGVSSSMVSRLVCKSSQDVVNAHSAALNVEHSEVVYDSVHNDGKQADARSSSCIGDAVQAASLDVHQLECRLRNAGLEERRRSTKKKNKLYYEELGPSLSSGISSNTSTTTNSDTLITRSTTEMHDMLLNANPAFDMDMASNMGDSMLSIEDLRASIAQRKLSHQASLGEKDGTTANDVQVNVAASSCSPVAGFEKTKVASRIPRPCVQNLAEHAFEEVSEKHIDVGVNKKLCFPEYGDLANQGESKNQSRNNTCSSTHKEAGGGQMSKSPRRTMSPTRRVDASIQKGLDAHSEIKKSTANKAMAAFPKGKVLHEAKITEALEAQRNLQESDRSLDQDFITLERPNCARAAGASAHDMQGRTLSSSCEIQVLSDYSYDPHSDDTLTHPVIRMHVNSTSPLHAAAHAHGKNRSASTHAVTSATSHHVGGAVRPLDESSLGHELMRSDSAVAMVKSSYDPKRDFKESMLEMVVAKRLRQPRQLQQLLQCYLSLNPSHYHPTIIKVFHELCSEVFS